MYNEWLNNCFNKVSNLIKKREQMKSSDKFFFEYFLRLFYVSLKDDPDMVCCDSISCGIEESEEYLSSANDENLTSLKYNCQLLIQTIDKLQKNRMSS